MVARATKDRDKYSNSLDYNKQPLAEGNLLAAMDPCEKYTGVKLNFYSDQGIVDTSYKFDYQPNKIAVDNQNFCN